MTRTTWLGGLTGAALLMLSPPGSRLQADEKAPVPAVAAACAACHVGATESWAASLHRRTVGAPQVPSDRQGCAACHRGTADHLADLSDESKRPSLAKLSGDQLAAICQSCHRGGKQTLWPLSAHARTKDACLTCHDPHQGKGEAMLKAPEPELCQQCHPGEVAEGNLPSHHPIQEGKMVCTDCHNVHGDQRGNLPEASNGEMCYRCHAEKQGPFLAEHPPVAEDCTTCHRPHGSPVDYLLTQDQPMLCLQCHTGHSDSHRTPLVPVGTDAKSVADAQQAIVGFYGRCTSCHRRIHGTDLSSGTGNPTFMPGYPPEFLGAGSPSGSPARAASMDAGMWGFSDADLGWIDEENNPTYVREYDGKNYEIPTSRLSIVKFGQQDDFRLSLSDLPRRDGDLSLRFGNPYYDVQVRESGLTHRLARYDDPMNVRIPSVSRGSGSSLALFTTDEAHGKNDYKLRRTLVDVRLAARCPNLPNAKWLLNYWREAETGSRQFLFLERCDGCHKIQTTERVDQITTIVEGGVQVDFPKGSIRYLRGEEDFTNRALETQRFFPGASSMNRGFAPLFGVASMKARTNDLRGAALVNERTSVAALWRTRRRENELGGNHIDIRSTGGGASYALTPDLQLQASYFGRRLDLLDVEEATSRRRDTSRADLRYTGLPNATWSVGYAKENVGREGEREMVPRKSDSRIWTSAFTYRPVSRVSVQLRYRRTNTDAERFFDANQPPVHFPSRLIGRPNDGRLFSGVVSYTLRDNLLLSGLYSKRDDSYEASVPTLGVFRTAEEETKTRGMQLVHTQGRGQLSAGFYRQEGDTRSNVTYGGETFPLLPPLVPSALNFPEIESQAAFHYRAAIQTLDGSLWATSRLRLFGRYARTATNGKETLYDLGDYLDQNPDLDGVAIILNPFDIRVLDRWLGVGYLLDRDTEVVLSHQRRSWSDEASMSHDGAYGLWRLGLRKQF